MRRSLKSMFPLFAAIILLQVIFAGCGATTASAAPTLALSTINTQHHKGKPPTIIKIGLNLPLSGVDASSGTSAEDGAQLAIDQANAAKLLPGYTLSLVAKDDTNTSGQPDGTVGANNVKALLKDAQVAGIIGPFDTNTAETELPLGNQAPIAMVSPSTTSPCLTQANPAAVCGTLLKTVRPTGKTTFFPLAPTDTQQGAALADFFYYQRAIRRVYVIDDATPYGKALAAGFVSEYTNTYGDSAGIVGQASVPPIADNDYLNVLQQIANAEPELIFYAGSDTTDGISLIDERSLVEPLDQLFFGGGNGINTQAFATANGFYANPQVFSTAPSLVASNTTFTQAYQARFGTLGTYSAYAYDSATVLINAIKNALAQKAVAPTSGNQPNHAKNFRQAVINQVQATNYTSVTGVQYTFNANGDPVNNTVLVDGLAYVSAADDHVLWAPFTTLAVH